MVGGSNQSYLCRAQRKMPRLAKWYVPLLLASAKASWMIWRTEEADDARNARTRTWEPWERRQASQALGFLSGWY